MSPFSHPPAAGIFDVDGVLLASPHEQAWREALAGFADPSQFTTAMYQAVVAGKPRPEGALAALQALDVRDAAAQAGAFAQAKQARLENMIQDGDVFAFRDAVRLVLQLRAVGWPMAVASASRNANAMMAAIRRPGGGRLLDAFTVNVFGRDLPGGKPDPAMFQLAAAELGVPEEACVVFEDAAAGVAAATAAGMRSIGVARLGDASALRLAGADLVVTSLDEVSIENLTAGPASRRRPDRGPRRDRWADANGGRGPSPERDAERTAPD